MTPLHLGALHPVEQWLTLALAFGPFVVLGVVVWWRRHQDGHSEGSEGLQQREGSGKAEPSGQAGRDEPTVR